MEFSDRLRSQFGSDAVVVLLAHRCGVAGAVMAHGSTLSLVIGESESGPLSSAGISHSTSHEPILPRPFVGELHVVNQSRGLGVCIGEEHISSEIRWFVQTGIVLPDVVAVEFESDVDQAGATLAEDGRFIALIRCNENMTPRVFFRLSDGRRVPGGPNG